MNAQISSPPIPRWIGLSIAFIIALKLAIHLIASQQYGFHRDELLHIVCGDHLAWGYMEFPPFIGWMAALQRTLFGDSLLAIRILPALAGTTLVLLTPFFVRALGGNAKAMLLATIATFSAHAYGRNHTLFQPVVFDQLFWTLSFLFLLWYLNTKDERYLIGLGVAAGLGLLNKYTMLFWGAGIGIAVLLSPQRWLFKKTEFWLAGLIASLLFLPNLIWQWQHDFPIFQHASGLYAGHFSNSRWDFLESQFWAMNFISFPLYIIGVGYLLLAKAMRPYRMFGWSFLTILALFLVTNGKPYYFFAIYPIFYAAGSVALFQWIRKRWQWVMIFPALSILALGIWRWPYMAPILPIEDFADYAGLEYDENGRLQELTGDYADMFGWTEQVALVDSVFQSLTPVEQSNCLIWAENYGEAGAVHHLGRTLDLPELACRHGSFWLWGPPKTEYEVVISLGNESEAVQYFFEETTLVKMVRHPYAIDEEHNIPLYLCRKPRITFQEYWPEWRDHIFD